MSSRLLAIFRSCTDTACVARCSVPHRVQFTARPFVALSNRFAQLPLVGCVRSAQFSSSAAHTQSGSTLSKDDPLERLHAIWPEVVAVIRNDAMKAEQLREEVSVRNMQLPTWVLDAVCLCLQCIRMPSKVQVAERMLDRWRFYSVKPEQAFPWVFELLCGRGDMIDVPPDLSRLISSNEAVCSDMTESAYGAVVNSYAHYRSKLVDDALQAEKQAYQSHTSDIRKYLKKNNLDGIAPTLQHIAGLQTAPTESSHLAIWNKFHWCSQLFEAMKGGRSGLDAWLLSVGMLRSDKLRHAYQHSGWRAEAGILMASHSKAANNCPGVSLVMSRYSGSPHAVCTSLLVYVPILHVVPVLGNKDRLHAVPLYDGDKAVLLPGVLSSACQGGFGGLSFPEDASSAVVDVPVFMAPLVLTQPRLELLAMVADCMHDYGSRGIQLTGVHGAGKSAFLEALVGIMCVGGHTDALYSGDAGKLLQYPLLALDLVKSSSGAFIDLLRGGCRSGVRSSLSFISALHETVVKQLVTSAVVRYSPDLSLEVQAPEAALQTLYTFCESSALATNEEYRVVILDEVNSVLAKLNDAENSASAAASKVDSSATGFFKRIMPWKNFGGARCFRILAASPDGKREDVVIHSNNIFFELRPPRTDHLAAVLMCAPEYLGLSMRDSLTAAQAENVCNQLASNMRYVRYCMRYVNGGQTLHAALQTSRGEYAGELQSRLQRAVSHAPPPDLSSGRKAWMRLMMHNASMVVRCNPLSSRSHYKMSGPPALLAAKHAVSAFRKKGGADEYGANLELLETVQNLLEEDDLEQRAQSLLQLGIFPTKWWPLDSLWQKLPSDAAPVPAPGKVPTEAAASGAWKPDDACSSAQARTLEQASHAWLSVCAPVDARALSTAGVEAGIPEDMFAGVGSDSKSPIQMNRKLSNFFGRMQPGERGSLLVRTADAFPSVDLVMLEWGGNTRTVTFIEVTKSTLVTHASSKPSTVLQSEGKRRRKLYLRRALRDVVAGMHSVRRQVVQQADGSISIRELPRQKAEAKAEEATPNATREKEDGAASKENATRQEEDGAVSDRSQPESGTPDEASSECEGRGSDMDTTKEVGGKRKAKSKPLPAAQRIIGGGGGISVFNATLAWLGVPLVTKCTFTRVPDSATRHSNKLDHASVSCSVAVDYTHVNALYGGEAVGGGTSSALQLSEEAALGAEQLDFQFRVVYFTSSDASKQSFSDLSLLTAPDVYAAFEWDSWPDSEVGVAEELLPILSQQRED